VPRRRLPRCTYCDRPGLGDPPLCREHWEDVHYGALSDDGNVADELLDRLFDNPRLQRIFAQFGNRFDDLLRQVSRLEAPARPQAPPGGGYQSQWPPRPPPGPPPGNGRPPPGYGGYQAPPPPPPPRQLEDPRVVLGFPPGSKPSRPEIKKRQRALAAFMHPDKGGNDDAMKRLNAAADALLREVA